MADDRLHFYQSDLHILYYNDIVKGRQDVRCQSEYYIVILLSGKIQLEYLDKLYIMKPGDTFLADKRENFTINYTDTFSEFVEIRFAGKPFHTVDKEFDILRPFYNKKRLKIFNIKNCTQDYNTCIKRLIGVLKKRRSRAFVFAAVLDLICEINYIFESGNTNGDINENNNFTKIVQYVDTHLFEKITIKSVAENTFISPRCITDTVKRVCGVTFHEWIESRRLAESKYRVRDNFMSLNEVASFCGFDTYSTFYRAFKKQFGISPKEYRKQHQIKKTQ